MIEFYHIEVSSRKYTGRGENISSLEFSLEFLIFCRSEIKVQVSNMMTIWIRLADIEVSIDSFWTRVSSFENYRFMELEVFLIRIIRWFCEGFPYLDKLVIFIFIVAKYPEIPRIIEISTEAIHAELVAFLMYMSSCFEKCLEILYRTVAVELHIIY